MSTSPDLKKDPSAKPLLDEKNINSTANNAGHADNLRPVISTGNNVNYTRNSGGLPTTSFSGPTVNGTMNSDYKQTAMASEKCQELEQRINRLQKWFKVALVIIIIAALIIIVLIPALYQKLNYDITHHTHKPKVRQQMAGLLQQESLCVPCDDFRLGPSPEEERMLNKFSLQDTENGLNCCVDTPEELMELLKMYVERRFRQEMAKGTINPWPRTQTGTDQDGEDIAKPAAHLMMTVQDLQSVHQMPGRQYQIGHWIHNSDLAFTQRTTYRHGRIVIPEDGLYFVYSQISFMEYYNDQRHDGYGSTRGSEFPSLSHYLYRYNINYHRGGEEKLAQNSITKCWGQSRQYGEYTSYLGAVFYLRNADEIFVKVSNISMVDSDPKLSYFGLYKI